MFKFRHLCVWAAAAVLFLPTGNAAAGITDNLVAHWTFDDEGNPYFDAAGSNHGTLQGTAPPLAPGLVGDYALELAGAGAVNVGSSADFDTTTFTISAWLNTDTLSGWRTTVGSWHGGALWAHLGKNSDTSIGDHGGGQTSGGSMQTDTWYHVVSVRNPGVENQLWINGLKTPQVSTGTPGTPGSNNVYIGSKNGADNLWDGKLDDIGIWDRALDPTEIREITRNGLVGNDLASTEAVSFAPTHYENADHSMAAGDFGIAYIDGEGNLRHMADTVNYPTVAVSGANATRVVAGDVDGYGGDEVIFVDGSQSGGTLKTYDFSTVTARGGSTISDITAADFYQVGRSVVNVVNAAGDMYFWSEISDYGAPVNNAGSLAHAVYFGEFDSAHAGPEFVGVYQPGNQAAGNNMRIISQDAAGDLTFTGISGGGIDDVTAANIYDNGGDNEVVLTNGSGNVYVWEDGYALAYSSAGGAATQLTSGDLDGDGVDAAYWINANDSSIYSYQYVDGSHVVEQLNVGNNDNWSKILVADLDRNGADELYGLKLGDYRRVWWLAAGQESFHTVPEPSGLVLVSLALLGLAWGRRRRQRG